MFTLSKKNAPFLRALVLAGLMLPAAAWGEDACMGTIAGGIIDFGEVDVLPGRTNTINIPVTVNITCTTDGSRNRRFHLCLALDSGRWPKPLPANSGDRYLCDPQNQCSNAALRMTYNFYTDRSYSQILGNILPIKVDNTTGPSNTLNTVIDVPANQRSASRSMTFYAQMKPQSVNLKPGIYQNPFFEGSTALVQAVDGANCGNFRPREVEKRVPFTVQATVVKRCHINAGEMNFGKVPANRNDINGQTWLQVTCTPGANYTIGLKPDHPSPKGDGWGIMQPKTGNGEGVPYSLHHDNHKGPLWGYAENLRGGSKQGNGQVQSYDVYGNVPSADYRPGEYHDTVRVEVSY